MGVMGDEVRVRRELGVVGHLDTCSSSLMRRSMARVRSDADFLASSSSSVMRLRAPVRSGMRVGELQGGPVSDRFDLARMVGEVDVQVGLLDRFLARSMRASVLELMVELEVPQVNMVVALVKV